MLHSSIEQWYARFRYCASQQLSSILFGLHTGGLLAQFTTLDFSTNVFPEKRKKRKRKLFASGFIQLLAARPLCVVAMTYIPWAVRCGRAFSRQYVQFFFSIWFEYYNFLGSKCGDSLGNNASLHGVSGRVSWKTNTIKEGRNIIMIGNPVCFRNRLNRKQYQASYFFQTKMLLAFWPNTMQEGRRHVRFPSWEKKKETSSVRQSPISVSENNDAPRKRSETLTWTYLFI